MGFEDLFREARERDEYWIENAVLSFTTQLYGLVKKHGLSQADLAERLGVSQPYIARVLKGKDNLTLATMVKLARAVGGRFEISLRDAQDPEQPLIQEVRQEKNPPPDLPRSLPPILPGGETPPPARSGASRGSRKKKPAPAG